MLNTPFSVPFVDGRPQAVQVAGVKAGRSVIQDSMGRVERILGADVTALKALVGALSTASKNA